MGLSSWLKDLFGRTQEQQGGRTPAREKTRPQPSSSEQDGKLASYISDAPVLARDQDRFDRWRFAERIADTIASREDASSIVIAVYGAWGTGKTTVLNFIDHCLQQCPGVLAVRFNPWTFGDQRQLLISFFNSLAAALGSSLTSGKEKAGQLIRDYGSIAAGISVSVGPVGVSAGDTFKRVGEKLSTVELAELRKRIEKVLEDRRLRVVVMMDDIDRMDKSEIQLVFKLIKLTADFKYTAYLLAFDDEMVAAALSEKYACEGGGRSFLEKIVQVPLRLPAADPLALRRLCFEGVEQALQCSGVELGDKQKRQFVYQFQSGLEVWLNTPRMAKQYGNALLFSVPLVKGEVDPVEFMLVEGLRVLNPILYRFVRDNPAILLCHWTRDGRLHDKENDRAREALDCMREAMSPDEAKATTALLRAMFPRLEGIFSNTTYGSQWDETWAKEQRIASGRYFSRYFTYAVARDDVADREIAAFLDGAESGDVPSLVKELKRLCGTERAGSLVSKLSKREGELSPESCAKLARAMAGVGEVFPRPQSMFPFVETFSQAAILVANLVKAIPPVQRLTAAEGVVADGIPLAFAVESLKWMGTRAKRDDAESALSEAEMEELAKTIVPRIRQYAQNGPVYVRNPRDAAGLLHAWADLGSSEEVSQYLKDTLESDPGNAAQLAGR
ncbi:MAG TPA: P-loop NTPase fold protein [Phycisphaerae bacterium]|nr:P-loop NTPase fold protein [Phycisphaerae bacterium]